MSIIAPPRLPLCTAELWSAAFALRRQWEKAKLEAPPSWTPEVVSVRTASVDRQVEFAEDVTHLLTDLEQALRLNDRTWLTSADLERRLWALRKKYYAPGEPRR